MNKHYKKIVQLIKNEGKRDCGVLIVERHFNTWEVQHVALAMELDIDKIEHGIRSYYEQVRLFDRGKGYNPIGTLWLDLDKVCFEW